MRSPLCSSWQGLEQGTLTARRRELTSTQPGFSLRYDAFANMASYAVKSVCVAVRVCERERGREGESETEREWVVVENNRGTLRRLIIQKG